VAGARDADVRYTGAFSEVSAIDLAAHASREVVKRSGANRRVRSRDFLANVMQTSADALYWRAARGVEGRIEDGNASGDVNRLCGSG